MFLQKKGLKGKEENTICGRDYKFKSVEYNWYAMLQNWSYVYCSAKFFPLYYNQ